MYKLSLKYLIHHHHHHYLLHYTCSSFMYSSFTVSLMFPCCVCFRAYVDATMMKKRRQKVFEKMGGFSQQGAVCTILGKDIHSELVSQDLEEAIWRQSLPLFYHFHYILLICMFFSVRGLSEDPEEDAGGPRESSWRSHQHQLPTPGWILCIGVRDDEGPSTWLRAVKCLTPAM